MKMFKKMIFLMIELTAFLCNNPIAQAYPTPIFDNLTPNLQEIMRSYGETYLNGDTSSETPEEIAELMLNKEYVKIDGSFYKGLRGRMKLTDEDIESLHCLPNVKQLDIDRFDLDKVDINKFLGINNNKTIKVVFLEHYFFGIFDKEKVKARIKKREYTVGLHPCFWIAWPGVDLDEIFEKR